jgi:hypothetical protein
MAYKHYCYSLNKYKWNRDFKKPSLFVKGISGIFGLMPIIALIGVGNLILSELEKDIQNLKNNCF